MRVQQAIVRRRLAARVGQVEEVLLIRSLGEALWLARSAGQAPPDSIVPAQPTADMAKSLSTFLAIYNATGTPIGSSVSLDGKLPVPPSGVFDSVKLHGEDRFTWQPKPGLRLAAVVTQYSGPQSGFVLVGRSLREVEIYVQDAQDLPASFFHLSPRELLQRDLRRIFLLSSPLLHRLRSQSPSETQRYCREP